MFKTGDTVIHPKHGVCKVKAKLRHILPETKGFVYVLMPERLLTGNFKLLIPEERIEKSGIHYPIKKYKIPHIFEILSDVPKDISDDCRKAYPLTKEKVYSGDSYKLAEAIRDLENQKRYKSSLARSTLLEFAKGVLIDEIVYVKNISKNEADELINNVLKIE